MLWVVIMFPGIAPFFGQLVPQNLPIMCEDELRPSWIWSQSNLQSRDGSSSNFVNVMFKTFEVFVLISHAQRLETFLCNFTDERNHKTYELCE